MPVGCYLLQHPEPQQPACSAFTLAGRHSSTQQTQVQLVHSQLPVSQHPQQSHFPQPTFRLLSVAGTKGTRASAAKRIRLFMGNILVMGTSNRSLHVTTCERGKATARATASLRLTPTDGEARFNGRFSSARHRRGSAQAGSEWIVTPPHRSRWRRAHERLQVRLNPLPRPTQADRLSAMIWHHAP